MAARFAMPAARAAVPAALRDLATASAAAAAASVAAAACLDMKTKAFRNAAARQAGVMVPGASDAGGAVGRRGGAEPTGSCPGMKATATVGVRKLRSGDGEEDVDADEDEAAEEDDDVEEVDGEGDEHRAPCPAPLSAHRVT